MSKEFDEHLVRFRNLPLPVRVVYGRPRTFIALAVGVIAFFLLPGSLRLPTRLVVGWDVFAALYLVLAYIMMLRCDVAHIRRSAVLQDDGRFLILLLTAFGALASLARDRVRARRLKRQSGRADPGRGDDRVVMGAGPHRLCAALRA